MLCNSDDLAPRLIQSKSCNVRNRKKALKRLCMLSGSLVAFQILPSPYSETIVNEIEIFIKQQQKKQHVSGHGPNAAKTKVQYEDEDLFRSYTSMQFKC